MLGLFPIIFGLLSAVSFGIGDFSGGFVTKKLNVLLVLLYSQIIGLLFLCISILIVHEPFTASVIPFGALSGIFGCIGLLAFYKGLSLGNMGIVAPITAIVTPIIPLFISIFEQSYSINQVIGIFVALASIWLVSSTKLEKNVTLFDIAYASIAGISFGLFLVFINIASTSTSILYPIVFARISSILITVCLIIISNSFNIPGKRNFGFTSLVGILDTVGNLFFILSSQEGRLDFASILLSLGPVVTVILAWKILKEKLTKMQVIGIILSVFAISLLSS